MTVQDSLTAAHNGNLIDCSKEEYYEGIRDALQEKAGNLIDSGDMVRATIHLNEVKRLDQKFNK